MIKSYIKNLKFLYNRSVQATIIKEKMSFMDKSLAHTRWMCKYHIIFITKYSRKIIYNKYRASIKDILKDLCKYNGVEIIEEHFILDHVYMLFSISPK